MNTVHRIERSRAHSTGTDVKSNTKVKIIALIDCFLKKKKNTNVFGPDMV